MNNRPINLHTRLMLTGTVAVNIIAMLVVLVLEYGKSGTLGKLPDVGDKLLAAWFQGIAPRSSGFNSVDVAALMPAAAFFIMGLMFIGGGSNSTASGIKLSTFPGAARIDPRLPAIGRTARHLRLQPAFLDHHQVDGHHDHFPVLRAYRCIFTHDFREGAFIDISFEAVSAFGTVGLSRGLTPTLSLPGQCAIMVLMLIGRVGPLTLAFTLANRSHARIEYPEGKVTVG